jgi:hypothetical protein
MAKPITKGPSITFRLPLELHELLTRIAAVKGESPGEYVARNFERSLRAQSKAVGPMTNKPPGCNHAAVDKKIETTGRVLYVCQDCGANYVSAQA